MSKYPCDPERYNANWTKAANEGNGMFAVAIALLEVAMEIRNAGFHIAGVDDFTGIMRIGAELEAMRKAEEKRPKIVEAK
jgi:hypothetical protein